MLVAPDLSSHEIDKFSLAKNKENYSGHKMNIFWHIQKKTSTRERKPVYLLSWSKDQVTGEGV